MLITSVVLLLCIPNKARGFYKGNKGKGYNI